NGNAKKPTPLARFPNPLHRIRCATHLPFTFSSRAPTSVLFNSCSAIAAWLPPPAICALPPPRFAPPPARLICSRTRFQSNPNRRLLSTSELRPMDHPRLEVADVLRRYGEVYREQHAASLSTAQRRVMSAIELCRTAALGGHLEKCDQCQHQRIA